MPASQDLADFFDQFDPDGELFCTPLDVTLDNRNVLQPDLLFISSTRKHIVLKDRIDGPCDLTEQIEVDLLTYHQHVHGMGRYFHN